jgi:hypothetical protein
MARADGFLQASSRSPDWKKSKHDKEAGFLGGDPLFLSGFRENHKICRLIRKSWQICRFSGLPTTLFSSLFSFCRSLNFQGKKKRLTSFCNMLYASELRANPYGLFAKFDLSEKIGDFKKNLWMHTGKNPIVRVLQKIDGSVPA